METKFSKHGGVPDLPAVKPFPQIKQGLKIEPANLNCGFGDISSGALPVPQKIRRRSAGKGAYAKLVAKPISTFKLLRPEDVWHPRIGARPGNQHALKHGRYTKARRAQKKRLALVGAEVREIERKARRAIFRAEDFIRSRAPNNPP